MKKRLGSRVVAVGLFTSTVLAASTAIYAPSVQAQDKPAAGQLLERGNKLYREQQFHEAKTVLLDIDPTQLTDTQRTEREELLKQTDLALAKAAPSNETFDSAKAALDTGKLSQARHLYEAVAKSPNATPELKQNARIQLELVKEKQKEQAPAMKALLKDAIKAYDEGRLDDAQNAINTINTTGSDLGIWDSGKPAKYQKKIDEKRVELAKAAAAPQVAAAAPAVVVEAPATAPAPPTDPAVAVVAPAPAMTTAPVVEVPVVPATMAAPAATTAPVEVVVAPATAPAPADSGLAAQYVAAKTLQQQQARAHFDHFKDLSTAALAAGNYQAAIDSAKDAKAQAEASASLYSADEAAALLKEADDLLKTTTAAGAKAADARTRQAAADADKRQKEISSEREKTKQARINRMMGDAMAAADRQEYEQAISLLDQVIANDPTNNSAKYLRTAMSDRANYRAWQKNRDREVRENVALEIETKEHMIPYSQLLIYPEDWPELSRKRQSTDQTVSESEANRKIRELLDTEMEQLAVEAQPFRRVIDYLQEKMREKMPSVNIVVNWRALDGLSISKDKEITIHDLRNVTFRKALMTVLSEASDGAGTIAFIIDDGVITISTKDEVTSPRYQAVRVYDIRDLLVQQDPLKAAPSFSLASSASNSGSGGGGSTNSPFGDPSGGGTGTTRTKDDIVKELLDTIRATVVPASWVENGGTIGTIREHNGQLLVNQTVDNQIAVQQLLKMLREQRNMQISIEARLLSVADDFFDQFGLSWDLRGPANQLGGNITGPFGTPNIAVVNSSRSMVDNTISSSPLATTALSTGFGAIIDNWQLNVLLSATQADKRSKTVNAPRVTFMDGGSGRVMLTSDKNYISNFNSTSTSGANGGQPTVSYSLTTSTLTTGVILDVQGTVSADKRYVLLKLAPRIASLKSLDTFVIGNANPLSSGSTTTLSGIFVQLPAIDQTSVDTMVSVPDGGTLLIGGQKLATEMEIEVGVPILSKIPGLNRLFTNRGTTKSSTTILILVRPKIIIQREEEYKSFGMNFDSVPSLLPGAAPARP